MKKSILASILLFGMLTGANAAGTDYNTDIANTASLQFTVSGISQPSQASNIDSFKVDRKVDVLVATTDIVNKKVLPGDNIDAGTGNIKPLTYTVTNQTNGIQDFKLNAVNLATGTVSLEAGVTDNVDFDTGVIICGDLACSAGDLSGQNIPFAEDQTKTFYVFADVPPTAANDNIASIALSATAVENGTTITLTEDTGADDQAVVQVVFADDAGVNGDTARSGIHSALSAYEVNTAVMALTKTSCVVWDPVNLTTNPKRIPGAVVRYAVNLANTGSAAATNVALSDTLQAELAYGTSGAAPAGVSLVATQACDCANPGLSNGDSILNSGQDVIVDFGTVNAGSTECAYFDVTIN